MKNYRGGPVVIGSTAYYGIRSWRANPGLNLVSETGASVERLASLALEVHPDLQADFSDIAAALTAVPLAGLADAAVKAYLPQRNAWGADTAGSTHFEIDLASCLAVIGQISAQQGQLATAGVMFHAVSDDGDEPYDIDDAALPAFVAPSKWFTVGPVVIDGTVIEMQATEFDNGANVQKHGHSGGPYARAAVVETWEPRVTARTADASQATAEAFAGEAVTDVEVWFRACQKNAVPFADDATEHVKIVIPEAMLHVGSVSGPERGLADNELVILPSKGAGALMTVQTGQAIDAGGE